MSSQIKIDADLVLLDIEGTLSSQSYVIRVLYAFSRARIPDYVAARRGEPEIEAILSEASRLVDGGDPLEALIGWQDKDLKVPPLKKLQGLIWEHGYREGAFKGHIYPDAHAALVAWKAAGLPLYIFSSGSVQAQIQFFQFSEAGDLRSLFNGHFDTDIGAKVEAASYQAIAARVGVPTQRIVFLTDNPRELVAADAAGVQVIQVLREDTAPDPRYRQITSFAEVDIVSRKVA
ncbi:acireductone synthase [Oryzibacter oryziterrae]|uniref:acireductone synthase n=1 Tax=Oryzibacter oryziterrae TaxID=2766474 RepID=UPI001F01D57E|nr:acireductone synthase [Oryzibacter oryziterrae]